jgi:hypothetical protein
MSASFTGCTVPLEEDRDSGTPGAIFLELK